MKNNKMTVILLCLIAGFIIGTLPLFGLADSGTPNSAEEAIKRTEGFITVQEKVQYLLHQGNEFMDGQKYGEAKKVAEHVVKELDPNSKEAQTLLESSKKKNDEEIMESQGELMKVKF